MQLTGAEGLFYRDGVNTSNAMDIANFVLPGAEVKDLLMPETALSFNIGLSDNNISMSAYYQLGWQAKSLNGPVIPDGVLISVIMIFLRMVQ